MESKLEREFYKKLVCMRAKREGGLINDRGFRHIKNKRDISGFSYAFWLITVKSREKAIGGEHIK